MKEQEGTHDEGAADAVLASVDLEELLDDETVGVARPVQECELGGVVHEHKALPEGVHPAGADDAGPAAEHGVGAEEPVSVAAGEPAGNADLDAGLRGDCLDDGWPRGAGIRRSVAVEHALGAVLVPEVVVLGVDPHREIRESRGPLAERGRSGVGGTEDESLAGAEVGVEDGAAEGNGGGVEVGGVGGVGGEDRVPGLDDLGRIKAED